MIAPSWFPTNNAELRLAVARMELNFQKSSVHPKLFGRAIVQRASQTRQSPRRRFANQARIKSECVAMRTFHNSSFDPQTLLLLETAFDEAWLTLKFVG